MNRLIYIVIIFLSASCEDPINWPMDENITPRLVVEGLITNNPDLNYVRLSLPVSSPNQESTPIQGATVILLTSGGNEQFLESITEPGHYITGSEITGVVGEGYRLYINIGGYEFLSDPVWMVPVSQLKELRFYEVGFRPGFYAINPAESNEASFIEYHVKYENPEIPGDTLNNLFYSYTLRTIDVNQFFKPDDEWLIFPEGAMVIRTKYSLAPDHERFIRGLLSETEWKGGWFDLSPGNLHTNMSAGAVGYFGGCSVLRDTIYLQ